MHRRTVARGEPATSSTSSRAQKTADPDIANALAVKIKFDEEVTVYQETKGIGASDVAREAFADFLMDKYLCRQLDCLGSSFLVKSVRKEVVAIIERLGAKSARNAATTAPTVIKPPTPPPVEGLDGTEWKDNLADMRGELDEFEGKPGKRFDHLGDSPWTCKVCVELWRYSVLE